MANFSHFDQITLRRLANVIQVNPNTQAVSINGRQVTTNGFDRQDTDSMGTLSWVIGTRTFSITVVSGESSFHFWCNGIKIVKTTTQSIVIPDTTGVYYIYFDNDGVLQYVLEASLPVAAFYEYSTVGIVRWNATQGSGEAGDERHGIRMSGATHWNNHETFGTLYVSGLDIEGLSDGGSTFTQITSGVFRDEDIKHSPTAQATCPFFYRLGAAGEWTSVTASNEVGLKVSPATYYQWNEWDGSTWKLTEGTPTSDYFITFFFATPIITAGSGIIKLLGQNSYATVAIARAAIETELSTLRIDGLPAPEIIFLYAVVVKRDGKLQELADGSLYYDLRSTTGKGVGGASADTRYAEDIPTDTTNFTGVLSSTDTDVQTALETLMAAINALP